MRHIKQTAAFKRDLKKALKRGKDPAKLYAIVEALATGSPLDQKNVPHPLTGNWKPCYDCHIEPDWLLIYVVTDEAVELVRTGTHADLFGK
jgi:mRNA interferase YafQ